MPLYFICANNKTKSMPAQDLGDCYDNLLGDMFAE